MAIAYRGAGAVTMVTGGGSVTPPLPTGWQAGDYMVLLYANYDNVFSTVPTDWQNSHGTGSTGDGFSGAFLKRAEAGDTNPTVGRGGGTVKIAAVCLAFTGVHTDFTPAHAREYSGSATGTGTTATTPTMDVEAWTNTAVVMFVASFAGSVVSHSGYSGTDPTFTELVDGGGANSNMGIAWGPRVASGVVSARSATLSASSVSSAWMIALREAAVVTVEPNNMRNVA